MVQAQRHSIDQWKSANYFITCDLHGEWVFAKASRNRKSFLGLLHVEWETLCARGKADDMSIHAGGCHCRNPRER